MKKKIVIANWKMNPATGLEANKIFENIAKSVSRIKKTEIVICPPYIFLDKLSKIMTSKVKLGCQDAFWGDVGPYTGEVSSEMLSDAGVGYAILGHSERRALGESNDQINKKVKAALASGLVPILCVGERERDESHKYFEEVKTQVRECLNGVSRNSFYKIIIAYEPVWALSTTVNRRDATPTDASEMAMFIRKILSDMTSPDIASDVRILYGGSVNERDVEEFFKNGGVDGVLVGKASLDPKKFTEIIQICEALKN